jgi:catecholate siderophore receptor
MPSRLSLARGQQTGIRSKPRQPAGYLAAGIATLMSGGAAAQEAAPTTMEPITIEDSAAPANTLRRGLGLGRLPGTVQDTPQTIQVIPQEILVQQNVTTLEQALRNVPSVTVQVGEGNGGMNGDMFRIRGFDAKGDIYVDGLRDFGVYVRDSFNMETVEVLKGPSSVSFACASPARTSSS